LDTKPTVSEIIDFVEHEAQTRVKEIQEADADNKKMRFVTFSKTVMATHGDKIREWVKLKDDELLATTCKEIIEASKL